jgi:NADH-quinone oxidoreductase subunit B
LSDKAKGDPELLVNENPDPLTKENVFITSVDKALNWTRQSSVWPLTFGLACCAIEMMASLAAKYDIDRFGSGVMRATPRQADLMIVAGTVSHKMAPRVKRLYDQMPDPKYVLAMGGCVIKGGPYAKYGYHVLQGVDRVVPVDVYVPGCPPRPEALIEGILKVRQLCNNESVTDRDRKRARPKVFRGFEWPRREGEAKV